MYICICNALKECDLKKACTKPCGDGETVLNRAGCKSECGQCLDYIENFLMVDPATISEQHIDQPI